MVRFFVNAYGQATRVAAVMTSGPNKNFGTTPLSPFHNKTSFFVLIVLRMFRTLDARNIRRLRGRAAKNP